MNHDIYVAEDNKTEGLLLKLALTGISGVKIHQFEDGESLVAATENLVPSIVISDLNLPGISGIDVIKSIKENHPKTRIIVVSATKEIDTIAKVQEMGVYNFLVKSEGCLKYLRNVIQDLLKLVELEND